jgi:hypothetical protein
MLGTKVIAIEVILNVILINFQKSEFNVTIAEIAKSSKIIREK